MAITVAIFVAGMLSTDLDIWLTNTFAQANWLHPHHLFNVYFSSSLTHGVVWSLLLNTLAPLGEVGRRLPGLGEGAFAYAREDVESQLDALYPPGFLYLTPWQWTSHYPRYMKALDLRLQRLSGQQHKDQQHTETLAALYQPLRQYLVQNPEALRINPELRQYRWLLEELRVSFFAQSLGTALPVSAKRLEEQWQRAEAWDKQNPV